MRRIRRGHLEEVVREAERRGRVVGVDMPLAEDDEPLPWTAAPSRRRKEPPIVGELPRSLELVLGNEIYIAKDGLAPGLRNRLLRVAAFQNPEFYKAQAMRLPTYEKPRIIGCAEENPHHIGLPRARLSDDDAIALANMNRVDESLPLFKKVFAMDHNWVDLTPRLAKVGLLPDDPQLIQKIIRQANQSQANQGPAK